VPISGPRGVPIVEGRNELDDAARHLGWRAGRRDVVLVVSLLCGGAAF
jgi:hypothetical protein